MSGVDPSSSGRVKKFLTDRRCQGIIDTMTSDNSLIRRPRLYAAYIVGAIVLIAVLSVGAARVDNDVADTVFGIFTGMTLALVAALVLWTEIGRKRVARLRDAAALDDLEPLRAATTGDRPFDKTASPSAGRSADRPAE
jgi:hypothetical protein